jgi:multidrug resistance efflux pump
MSDTIGSETGKSVDARVVPLSQPIARNSYRPQIRIVPLLITLTTAALAIVLGWAMWNAYMEAPWTRDGTVRTYIVTKAPEVAGHIVELPVVDNQFVHKGDLLLVIDPTDYKIAGSQAQAAVQQAQANVQNIDAQIAVQQAQIGANQAQVTQAQAALDFARWRAQRYQSLVKEDSASVQTAEQYASQLRQQEAALESAQATLKVSQQQVDALRAQRMSAEASRAQAGAQLDQAHVNLERTQIRSPVNGWVTNLLVQLGDYATVGRSAISIVNADAFWVDAYFEETQLASVHEGDAAKIKLMGYGQIVRGEVGGVARGINIPNAQPNGQGLASVNPIFTWVRLAQRVPVRIQIREVPAGLRLIAGLTATVEVEPRARRRSDTDDASQTQRAR